MTNVTNNVTINVLGGDSALRSPWFTDYENPPSDDEEAPIGSVFEVIGSFSKATVLEHLKRVCQRDKGVRDTMFWELLQNTTREENPYNDRATPEPARSSSDNVVIDLTTNPPMVQQQSSSRKRKLEDTDEHTLRRPSNPPRLRGGLLCGQCNEICTKQLVEKGRCRYHSGTLEVDEDSMAWTAWEKEAGVSLDTMDKRLARPKGFRWSCCRVDGTSLGCMVTKHQKKRTHNYHAKIARVGFRY